MIGPTLMRMLVAVSEEGSIGRAADRLGLTQQAISAQIKKLEGLVNHTIVTRNSRGVELTHDGEVLLSYAKRSLLLEGEVRRHFANVQPAETLRLGITEGFTGVGLPLLLRALNRERSDLDVTVLTGRTQTLERAIDRGAIDIVIGGQRIGEGRGEPILTYTLRWFGTRGDHPGDVVRLAANPAPSVVRSMMIDCLVAAGLPFSIVFESESRSSLRAAVLAGIAITAFSFEPASPDNSDIGLPDPGSVEMFVRKRGNGGAAADAMLAILRENAPQLAASARD